MTRRGCSALLIYSVTLLSGKQIGKIIGRNHGDDSKRKTTINKKCKNLLPAHAMSSVRQEIGNGLYGLTSRVFGQLPEHNGAHDRECALSMHQ